MLRRMVVALAVLSLPAAAAAQVSWHAPPLVGTGAPHGLSLFMVDPAPEGGLGAMAQWRARAGSLAMGYRAGITSDETAVFGGIDISGVLASSVEDADVDVRWWTGLGAGVGDEVMVSIPVGLVVGWQGSGDGVGFAPWAGGHAALEVAGGEGESVTMKASVDLGADLTLVSGWVVRFAASLGGREALAVGLSIPSGGSPQN